MNIQDDFSLTPLLYTALREDQEIDSVQSTFLKARHTEIIKVLITSGAFINFQSRRSETALIRSLIGGNKEMAHTLIQVRSFSRYV